MTVPSSSTPATATERPRQQLPSPRPARLSRLDVLTLLDEYHAEHLRGDGHLKSATWNLTKARRSKGGFASTLSSSFAASDVREDLVARTVLKKSTNGGGGKSDGEPSLVGDNDSNRRPVATEKKGGPCSTVEDCCALFRVVDVVEEQERDRQREMKENEAGKADERNSSSSSFLHSDSAVSESSSGSGGLRLRKSGAVAKSSTTNTTDPAPESGNSSSSWKVEYEQYDTAVAVENAVKRTVLKQSPEKRLQAADPLDLFGAFPPRELKAAQQEAKRALESYVRAANLRRVLLSKLT